MIVILASRWDPQAAALAQQWKKHQAAVLSCEDLSTQGWKFLVERPLESVAVVDGKPVPIHEIRGVLTRRPQVFESELLHLAAEDRAYAAAEMNAFLVAWLASLPCPVLNPPTAISLSGPGWPTAQWTAVAARAGFQVNAHQVWGGAAPPDRGQSNAEETKRLVVVGKQCFGAPSTGVVERATALAVAAGAPLLEIRFQMRGAAAVFHSATPFPPLTEPLVVEAVLKELLDRKARQGSGTSAKGVTGKRQHGRKSSDRVRVRPM